MTKKGKKLVAVIMAILMVLAFLPVQKTQTAFADTLNGTLLAGDELNSIKVRIRPSGSFKPLSINEDGEGNQNCVHLYFLGKSSQFYLQKADADSYYINFYKNYYDENPKTSGDCRLDLEDDGGYSKEGQVIHVVAGNSTAENKRWQFIRQEDGSYHIRNKKTGKFWTLQGLADDPNKKFQNNTKLVQSSDPIKWDIEIVCKDNDQFASKVQYDSRNFTYNGITVCSNNWMSALPDDLKITDISIPGSHDVGSCHLHKDQDSMSTQRYYIDEILNAGARHLDIRTGLSGETVRIVHSDCHALNHEGNDLTLREAMDWIIAFLQKNPGETVIMQPKMDKEGGKCDYLTYSTLREYAVGKGKYIWSGDHVPTLGEVRGKILVLSRLNTDNDYEDFNYDTPGTDYQWALDLDHWNNSNGAESEDRAAAHTASGHNFDVWVQDNYKHTGGEKKDYIQKTLYGNKGDGYTNGTQYHYDESKKNGKDAWILNYTSASHKSVPYKTPFDLAKEIHQWMLDRSDDYNRESERIIRTDTFTGILAFDYVDGLLSTFIYKTNFKRDYITVHGRDTGGKITAAPLVLQIGENDQPQKILSGTTKKILEGQYNGNGYELIQASNGDYLAESIVTDQADLDSKAAAFRNHAVAGNVPSDLYVHLFTTLTEIRIDVNLPKCGTAVSGDDPQVSVDLGSDRGSEVQAAYIAQDAGNENPFTGTVEGGARVPILVRTAPKWGYRFGESCTARSGSANISGSSVQGGVVTIRAEALIPHDAERIEAQSPTCLSNGTREHYECRSCHKLLLEKRATGSDEAVLVEVDEDEIIAEQAMGHEWGEWEWVTPATEDHEGEMRRRCINCPEEETLEIPKSDHQHVMVHVDLLPETCISEGNIEHYKCTGCELYSRDAERSRLLSQEDIILPPATHNWEAPEYLGYSIGETYYMTASMKCNNDASHTKTETVPAAAEITPAACETAGSIALTGVFTNQTFGTHGMEISVDALGHDWSEFEVKKKATCREKGLKTRICRRCGKTETEDIPVDPKAHDIAVDFDETTNTATCEKAGRAVQYGKCLICGTVISQESVETTPLGHDWGEPVYKWSEDLSEVTASRECKRSGCGKKESEKVKTTTRIMEEASCETEGRIKYDAQFKSEAFDTQEKAEGTGVPGHDWGEWVVTKEPTETAEGERQRVCKKDPSHIETEVIPAKNTGETAIFPGDSEASADRTITGMTGDSDPKGSVYNELMLRSTAQTKTSITLKWSRPDKAVKFVLYGGKCETGNKMDRLAAYTGSKHKVTGIGEKKIEKGTYYKFIMVALDKNDNVVSTSKVIYIATKGGGITNPKKMKVKEGRKTVSKLTVMTGTTVTVNTNAPKASKNLNLVDYRDVMYESGDEKIATVTSGGEIKGVDKGKCYIYAYAQNGDCKKVKVIVK